MDHKGIHEDTQQHIKRTQLMLRTLKAGSKEFKSLRCNKEGYYSAQILTQAVITSHTSSMQCLAMSHKAVI